MAFNPDVSLNMLQRIAAQRAIKSGTNLPPQMIGDSTGVSQMDPAFMAAVRQEMMGQGPEEQPEVAQPQAAPEAPQNSPTAALMAGAADAGRVAAMANGGEVKGYAEGGKSVFERLKALLPEYDNTTRDDTSILQAQGYSLPLDMPLKERMRRKAEGEAYRSQQEMANRLAAQRGVEVSPGIDPSFNAAESTLTKEPMPMPTSLQGFAPPQVSPVDYAPSSFQAPEAPAAVAVPRANAAAAAAKALTTPPPAAVEPGKPDPAAEAMNARKQEESNAYKERMDKLLSDDQPLSAQDKWMALARAGFAAAAGSSPFALQNIGAGLSKGVESLDELRKERAINRMKQATLLQSQRSEDLSNEARNRQLDISSRGVEIQGAREKRESEADIAERPAKMELLKAQAQAQLASAAYSLSGVELRKTSGGKADNIMTRAKALMAEAEESGNPISLDEAIQRQYKDTSQLNQKDLVTLATKLIDPTALYGKTPEQVQSILQETAQGILKITPNSQRTPSGSAPPPAGSANVVNAKTQADIDNAPSGATIIVNGQRFIKP